VGIFAKEVFKMSNYRKALKTRTQYALSIGLTDWTARIALYRQYNHGWQKTAAGFEHLFARRVPGSMFISLITAPISVPFEMAKMA
jgi:solute carrier family 25 oxoglutarate transporter 11